MKREMKSDREVGFRKSEPPRYRKRNRNMKRRFEFSSHNLISEGGPHGRNDTDAFRDQIKGAAYEVHDKRGSCDEEIMRTIEKTGYGSRTKRRKRCKPPSLQGCRVCGIDACFWCCICEMNYCRDHYIQEIEGCRGCLTCEKCGAMSRSDGGIETISVCMLCGACCRKHLWKDEYGDEYCYDCIKGSNGKQER